MYQRSPEITGNSNNRPKGSKRPTFTRRDVRGHSRSAGGRGKCARLRHNHSRVQQPLQLLHCPLHKRCGAKQTCTEYFGRGNANISCQIERLPIVSWDIILLVIFLNEAPRLTNHWFLFYYAVIDFSAELARIQRSCVAWSKCQQLLRPIFAVDASRLQPRYSRRLHSAV